MSILNLANCGNTTNIGIATCPVQPGLIVYAVAMPKGTVIPATSLTDAATFLADFKEYFAEEDTRRLRFYMSPLLTDVDDKTGDPVTENRNNYEATVAFKPYNWGWKLNGSFCEFKNWQNLMNFNQALYDFLFIDDAGQVWGTAATDSTDAAGLGGFSMFEVTVAPWTPKTSANNPVYMFRLKFLNNTQINANAVFVQANCFPDSSWGLLGTTLTVGTTSITSTHYYVKGLLGCGSSSLGETYGSDLAAAGAWVVRNVTDSTNITPSAVAYDSDTDEYDFTVSAQTAADVINIKLAAPSVLTGTPYFLTPAPITETGVTFAAP